MSRADVQRRFSSSALGHVWRRLDSLDFLDRGMLFSAVLLLGFVPFLIIVQSLAGRSTSTAVIKHFGLSATAATAVSEVFTSPSATSSAISGPSYVLFVLGGVAAATAIQGLYESVFDLEPRGMRDTGRRLVWLATLVGLIFVASWGGAAVRHHLGPVVMAIMALVLATGFWWFTMWILLAGRKPWAELFPSALATSVCWLGLGLFFRAYMSSTITTNYAKYGPIGVVFSIMSFFIGVGVVIILGAIFGLVWQERRRARRAPTPSPRGESPPPGEGFNATAGQPRAESSRPPSAACPEQVEPGLRPDPRGEAP